MRQNWRDTDQAEGIRIMRSMGVEPSTTDFATGATGWATWSFDLAAELCIYDEPSACVERLQELQEKLPTMYECILEFNRRNHTQLVINIAQ